MQYVFEKLNTASAETWNWFNTLTRDEWMIVLVLVTALGFLCMRGYGSRSSF